MIVKIDLSTSEDQVIYKDKGYYGVKSKGHDATLQKKPKGGELSIREKLRNKRISIKRALVERPYAVIKNVFKSGHTRLTTIARNQTDNLMKCTAFNLIQLPRLLSKIGAA